MTIIGNQINPIGGSGQMPNLIFLSVNNTFEQITQPGFLNAFIASGGNRISPLDIALVAYSIVVNTPPTQSGFFVISFSDGNWTLVPYYGTGTVFNVTASTPLTSTEGSSPNIALSPSGVGIGTYSNANITLDLYGRVTSAGNGVPSGVIAVTASTPISSTGGNTPNISLIPSGVTSGTYVAPNLNIDSYGRVTSASNGTYGSVTAVTASTPISSTGGNTPNISISPSGVTAGSYTNTTLTVNSSGLVTSASSGTAPVTNITVSSPLATTGGTTPNLSISSSGISPGTYTFATFTVNQYGLVTSAGSGSPGTVTNVTASSPITSTSGTTPNIAISPSGVTSGTYTNGTFSVNNYGLVTSAANGTAPLTSLTVSSPLSSTGGTTPTITVSPSGVSAGTYTFGTFTVNNQGIVTSAGNGSPGTVTSVSATSPLNSSGGATPLISISTAIPVASGGTGATTLTSNALILGNGTSALSTTSLLNGQMHIGYTGSAPTVGYITAGTNIVTSSGAGTFSIATTSSPAFAYLQAFSTTSGIVGSSTNDNAAAGSVGQVLTASLPAVSGVTLSTGVAANVTSLSLTAGDWDIWGTVVFQSTGGATQTLSVYNGNLSTTSGSNDTTLGQYFGGCGGGVGSIFNQVDPTAIIPAFPVHLSSTTNYYLNCYAGFGGTGTLSAFGIIYARRRR